MKRVIALRGIPGSGKSTWAKAYLASHPPGTVARINNDELVASTFGTTWRVQRVFSDVLREIRHSLLETYLKSEDVEVVIIDNTNLDMRTVASLQKITYLLGADFEVNDEFLSVPLDVCIERDASRGDAAIGADVIVNFYSLAIKLKPWKVRDNKNIPVQDYDNSDVTLPGVYIFDIDGTLALNTGRDIYDLSRVHEDALNTPVASVLLCLAAQGYKIIFMSGRKEDSRAVTTKWLSDKLFILEEHIELHMRPTEDRRPDYLVKYDLFMEHIAGKYRVLGSFDDRDQVVDLWRNKLGLPTFQVLDGDF